MDLFFRTLARLLPDHIVQQRYVLAGGIVGSSISYLHVGRDIHLEAKIQRCEFWEREYVRRGYIPISHGQFIDYGGFGIPLTGLGTKAT